VACWYGQLCLVKLAVVIWVATWHAAGPWTSQYASHAGLNDASACHAAVACPLPQGASHSFPRVPVTASPGCQSQLPQGASHSLDHSLQQTAAAAAASHTIPTCCAHMGSRLACCWAPAHPVCHPATRHSVHNYSLRQICLVKLAVLIWVATWHAAGPWASQCASHAGLNEASSVAQASCG
jgi:hypothetical protein